MVRHCRAHHMKDVATCRVDEASRRLTTHVWREVVNKRWRHCDVDLLHSAVFVERIATQSLRCAVASVCTDINPSFMMQFIGTTAAGKFTYFQRKITHGKFIINIFHSYRTKIFVAVKYATANQYTKYTKYSYQTAQTAQTCKMSTFVVHSFRDCLSRPQIQLYENTLTKYICRFHILHMYKVLKCPKIMCT